MYELYNKKKRKRKEEGGGGWRRVGAQTKGLVLRLDRLSVLQPLSAACCTDPLQ